MSAGWWRSGLSAGVCSRCGLRASCYPPSWNKNSNSGRDTDVSWRISPLHCVVLRHRSYCYRLPTLLSELHELTTQYDVRTLQQLTYCWVTRDSRRENPCRVLRSSQWQARSCHHLGPSLLTLPQVSVALSDHLQCRYQYGTTAQRPTLFMRPVGFVWNTERSWPIFVSKIIIKKVSESEGSTKLQADRKCQNNLGCQNVKAGRRRSSSARVWRHALLHVRGTCCPHLQVHNPEINVDKAKLRFQWKHCMQIYT
jgi:hypothetical protein